MDDSLQSLSKGVFVLPFSPQEEDELSGLPDQGNPAAKELFDEIYASTLSSIETAYSNKEHISRPWTYRTGLKDVKNHEPSNYLGLYIVYLWLSFRMPQSLYHPTSPQLDIYHYTLQGARNFTDLASAIRSIAIGLIGDATVSGKRTGRSGLDELEIWWKSQPARPVVIHVRDAQMIPSSVLSELIYALTLHPSMPLRVLLSVPSSAIFLSTWVHIEPSAIDMCILQAGRIKRKAGGVDAIMRGFESAPLSISDDLADELLTQENQLDGGPKAALKTLKWALLDFYADGPLAKVMQNAKSAENQRKVVQLFKTILSDPGNPDVPENIKRLLELPLHDNLSSIHDPSPRLAILHALSDPEQFVSFFAAYGGQNSHLDTKDISPKSVTHSNGHVEERNNKRPRLEGPPEDESEGLLGQVEELKRLKVLFGIWKEAGKSVNLWDWLEEFRDVMDEGNTEKKGNETGEREKHDGEQGSESENAEIPGEDEMKKSNGNGDRIGRKQQAEEEERLHAIFVRFVEEARMLGLIRAKGKQADEVLKSVGLV